MSILLLVSILSVAASTVALVTFAGDLLGTKISGLSRSQKGFLLFVFSLLSAVIGTYWHRANIVQNRDVIASTTPAPARVQRTDRQFQGANQGDATANTSAGAPSLSRPSLRIRKPVLRDAIKTGAGQTDVELTANARQALDQVTSSASLEGTLTQQVSDSDPSMGGLVTCTMSIDLAIYSAAGQVLDAFRVTARGGGFTEVDATQQARERIGIALLDRIVRRRQP